MQSQYGHRHFVMHLPHSIAAFFSRAVLLFCATVLLSTTPAHRALAQLKQDRVSTANLPTAFAIIDHTSRSDWRPPEPADPSFSSQLDRFLTKHNIKPSPDYRLEVGVSPVWLQDDIMGHVRDRTARPQTGPEMGTFYDRDGRLRFWAPNPPPRGNVRILRSPPMELLRKYTKGFVDWDDSVSDVIRKVRGPYKSELTRMLERNARELSEAKPLYRSIAKIAKDARTEPPVSGSTTPPAKADPTTGVCSFEDGVLDAITQRLAAEASNPSRLASLVKFKVRDEDARKKLLNCICRVHSGKSSSVSVWYQTTPHDGSDNCKDVSNGPCVGQGYGCSRSKFVPDQEALEACGAATLITQGLCRRSAGK